MMKDDDFKLLKGFALGQTNKQTDICDCRVAFATEKQMQKHIEFSNFYGVQKEEK